LGVTSCADSADTEFQWSPPGSVGNVDSGLVVDAAVEEEAAVDADRRETTSDTCEQSCPAPMRCRLGQCVPDLGSCADSDDCWRDSHCHEGECLPYGVPAERTFDESCERTLSIDNLKPDVQCRWRGPPFGDRAPFHVQVMSTPIVLDLDLDDDPTTLRPSIVFTSFPSGGDGHGEPGVVRIIDGSTCQQQHSLREPAMGAASPAAGDLDGDGRPEIVTTVHGGGLRAYRYEVDTGSFVEWWRSATCSSDGARRGDSTGGGRGWSGPSIYDVDDDGMAEIVHGRTVYDGRSGCMLSAPNFVDYSVGVIPVVADVDGDGQAELVTGSGIFGWNAGAWSPEAYSTVAPAEGQVAVADFGPYAVSGLEADGIPEVVVISSGQARIQTLAGETVFGPFDIPGGGRGGPPTVADFDGDGRPEFATAGGSSYVVFDPDCAGGDAAGCGGAARTDGVLWRQRSQDESSNITGSSVFDFDADGRAEAVYADECFLRIYDGRTGDVVFSTSRSSATAYENPVVADVDGDFHAEIVSSLNDYTSRIRCPLFDPLSPSTLYRRQHGVVVLRDVTDRWAVSRPVWNQHAYSVTHVGERGQTPRTSEVSPNWTQRGLNNFRQNVQGELSALGIADLTANVPFEGEPLRCEGGSAQLSARICNRGTLPSGGAIAFRQGSADGKLICDAEVQDALGVGDCQQVTCAAELDGARMDIYIVADALDVVDECYEGNNIARLEAVSCPQLN